MLVLTRKKNETLCIGENIEITILEVNGDQIKLGINAPKEIEVHRKEVVLRVKEQNKEALQASLRNMGLLKAMKFKK